MASCKSAQNLGDERSADGTVPPRAVIDDDLPKERESRLLDARKGCAGCENVCELVRGECELLLAEVREKRTEEGSTASTFGEEA